MVWTGLSWLDLRSLQGEIQVQLLGLCGTWYSGRCRTISWGLHQQVECLHSNLHGARMAWEVHTIYHNLCWAADYHRSAKTKTSADCENKFIKRSSSGKPPEPTSTKKWGWLASFKERTAGSWRFSWDVPIRGRAKQTWHLRPKSRLIDLKNMFKARTDEIKGHILRWKPAIPHWICGNRPYFILFCNGSATVWGCWPARQAEPQLPSVRVRVNHCNSPKRRSTMGYGSLL